MKKKIISILIIAISVLVLDKALTLAQDSPSKTTPYQIVLPDFVNTYLGEMPIPPNNLTTIEGVALGKKLFYDKRLSINNSISCASCHNQLHGFSDFRTFSLGVHDSIGIIQSQPIINLAWSPQLFWNGRAHSLEQQANDPINNPIEMASHWNNLLPKLQLDSVYPQMFYAAFGSSIIDSANVLKAIAQFERTLVSFGSRFDKFYFEGDINALNEQEQRGLEIFMGKGMCNHCHSDVLLTDDQFRNNGLDVHPAEGLAKITHNKSDVGKFKVPTLRNIANTAPYMHDGRFSTLIEVVDFYSEDIHPKSPNIDMHMEPFGRGLKLTEDEKIDLLAFLKTFTDTAFLFNPNYKFD